MTLDWGYKMTRIYSYLLGVSLLILTLASSVVLADPVIEWNTFAGSSVYDYGRSVATDASGNVYVAGEATATWGTPIRAYGGNGDVVVVKFNASGVRQWHTFLGSPSSTDDYPSITTDNTGNIYVRGTSSNSWGSPMNAHSGGGGQDAFLAKLSSNGTLFSARPAMTRCAPYQSTIPVTFI